MLCFFGGLLLLASASLSCDIYIGSRYRTVTAKMYILECFEGGVCCEVACGVECVRERWAMSGDERGLVSCLEMLDILAGV